MGTSEAVGLFFQSVILAVGLQFIGWAKWRARIAEEAWRARDGPADARIIIDLRQAVDETSTHVRRAGQGLEAAAQQLAREAA